jgi:ADP-dependent NAD(P)H-hydrate dehydratase / NAD(P)H-hydrate epimerase
MRDPAAFPELLTPAEMSKADRFAIAAGTPGIQLMERAGLAVADEAARLAKSRGRIVVLCGPGGNGGDGFIAARLLASRGYAVEVGLLGPRDALKGDPALAAARYPGPALDALAVELASADCVIDALFGAGLARDIDGEAKAVIERVNAFARAGGRVLAVDVPSGVDGETGKVRGVAVEASASVTFFRLKPGHLLAPGRALCGEIRLADIGIPEAALAPIGPQAFVNAPAVWREALPRPNAASHKYARGAVLVLSGAGHHTGAARLAARAALRAGAGIVTVASPPDALAVNAAHLTAVMVAPFANAREFEALLADTRRRAIALGPGAGVGPTLRKLVAAALTRPAERRTIVLDADALTSFAGDAPHLAALVKRGGHQAVLTPHEGEFARLFEGAPGVRLDDDKLKRARAAARLMGAVVLIKGADTVVAAPDGRATIGWDLPPWLATAGSGDVLSGFIAGLAAQEMPAFEAASAGVWLHGACGRAVGPGLIAEDLPEALPQVLRGLG